MARDAVTAFGQYLRLLRLRRGLTLGEVETLSGQLRDRIDRGNLSRWEHGRQAIGISKLLPLSRIYHIPIDALLERLELDLECERVDTADRADLDLETLNRLRREASDRQDDLLRVYTLGRDALARCQAEEADPEELARATLACASAAKRKGYLRYALHEFEHVEATCPRPSEVHAWAVNRLASVHTRREDLPRAHRFAHMAVAEAEQLGLPALAVATYTVLANASLLDAPETTVIWADRALAARDAIRQAPNARVFVHHESVRPTLLATCAESYLKQRRAAAARRALTAGAALCDKHQLPRLAAQHELLFGDLSAQEGRPAGAERHWTRGLSLAQAVGDRTLALHAENRLFRRQLETRRRATARATVRRLRKLVLTAPPESEAVRDFWAIEREWRRENP